MKKPYYIIVFCLIFIIGNYSCSDFLDEVPKSLISLENYWQTEDDALTSLNSVYDKMGSGNGVYYRNFRYVTLLMSDEGYPPQSGDWWSLNTYMYDSRNSMIAEIWFFSYDAINRANAIIDNVPEMDFQEQNRNLIIGEAKFLRALNYFNLVRFFGEVPLKLSETNSLKNLYPGLSSINEVYDLILEDLAFAENNLSIRKRGTADANGRADLAAVKMLIAKVYMAMAGYPLNDISKWSLSLQKAKELINMRNDFGLDLWDNYLDAYSPAKENGKEDIFSIQFKSGLGAPFVGEGSLQHIDNFNAILGRRGNWLDRPTVKLKQMFEPKDERGIAIMNYRTVNGTVYNMAANNYIFYKYVEQNIVDANSPANDGDKNFPVFRYADLLLMCAEAENEVNGPTTFAYECINKVRTRSKASLISGLSKEDFRNFILNERSRELYNEGHRWFDLVRSKKLIEEVTKANNLAPATKPNIPTEKNYWLPYPEDEVSYNPNIKQREGF